MMEDDEYIDKSSKVGKLIQRINHLGKKNVLDDYLGEILDSFMQYLVQSENYLKNGILKINFAEAALLIQGSALIYSKKVDLLWDVMNEYQKCLISFRMDGNEIELQKIEERETKYKRKRKQIDISRNKIDIMPKFFTINSEEICDFQNLYYEKDSKLYASWYTKILFKWELQPDRTPCVKQMQFRSPGNTIFDKDQDNEFTVDTSKMESVTNLEELLLLDRSNLSDFSFKLYSSLFIIPKFLKENQYTYKQLGSNFEEVEKYLENCRDEQFLKASMYVESGANSPSNKHSLRKLRRISVSASVSRLDILDLDNTYFKECQENFTEKKVDIDCHIIDLPSPEITGGKDIEVNIISTAKLSDYLNCEDESTNEHNTSSLHKISIEDMEKPIHHEISISESFKNLSGRCEQINKTKEIEHERKATRSKARKMSDNELVPEKRRKLSKAALRELATGISADLEKFNSFFEIHYQPAEGEGQVDLNQVISDHPLDSSSRISIGDASQLSDHPILNTQDSGYESNFPDHDESCVNDDFSSVLGMDKSQQEEDFKLDYCISENTSEVKDKPLYQQLYEWKQYMSEKFKNMKSADFDIHKYGSEIMENFEEGYPRKFSNIVRGKSASEVTRFFISALQLANTSNVEIQGVKSGKLSNETFQLKLISKDQYYDRLRDYMAPSEQGYIEHSNFVQKVNQKRSLKSSTNESNVSKRNKYE